LHQIVDDKDSNTFLVERNRKGDKISLNGRLNGFGSDSALSGQTRLTGRIWLRYAGARLWTIGPRRRPVGPRRPRAWEEAGWAEPGIWPKSLRKLENHFPFSKLFYKLQTNLMTSTCTIKYKSTSSHHEKYATT
jgi:hypothetical protein